MSSKIIIPLLGTISIINWTSEVSDFEEQILKNSKAVLIGGTIYIRKLSPIYYLVLLFVVFHGLTGFFIAMAAISKVCHLWVVAIQWTMVAYEFTQLGIAVLVTVVSFYRGAGLIQKQLLIGITAIILSVPTLSLIGYLASGTLIIPIDAPTDTYDLDFKYILILHLIHSLCYSFNPESLRYLAINTPFLFTLLGSFLCCGLTIYRIWSAEKNSKSIKKGNKLRFYALISLLMGVWRTPGMMQFFISDLSPELKVASTIFIVSEGAVVSTVFIVRTKLLQKMNDKRKGIIRKSKHTMDDDESSISSKKTDKTLCSADTKERHKEEAITDHNTL
jgi:hypothetical protein